MNSVRARTSSTHTNLTNKVYTSLANRLHSNSSQSRGTISYGFEENELAFLYPEETDEVRFAKLVGRDSAGEKARAAS